jgi:excisionase family DNA binding protein
MSTQQNRKTKQASADVLDVHEAGWLLGAHIETVRRLARRGGLPAYKVGKDWRFSKQALNLWMETRSVRQQAPLVLVVDDEKSIRVTVAAFLEKDGYRVAVAENGQQAVEAAQREMPNLVLLDLAMPDMSGVAVLKTLRCTEPDLPVVIVTAYPDSNLMVEALRYPPVTLLPKPVDKDVLLRTVRQVLHGATGAAATSDRGTRP